MEGEGGLRPCQLRVWLQSSRAMPLACLCRVCCVFWSCITVMASLCALVVTLSRRCLMADVSHPAQSPGLGDTV